MSEVKLLQLGWTVVAALTLLFQGWVIADVQRDRGSIDSPSSWWTWWRELLRAYGLAWVQIVMAGSGLYAFLGPQPVESRNVGAQIFAGAFISVELVLFGISAASVYVRRKVREIERAEILAEWRDDG
jgi:hypothetical protein